MKKGPVRRFNNKTKPTGYETKWAGETLLRMVEFALAVTKFLLQRSFVHKQFLPYWKIKWQLAPTTFTACEQFYRRHYKAIRISVLLSTNIPIIPICTAVCKSYQWDTEFCLLFLKLSLVRKPVCRPYGNSFRWWLSAQGRMQSSYL